MTDNELLLVISKALEPVRDDIQGIKSDIQEMKGDIQGIQGDIQEIKVRVTKIEMTQENEIKPRLQNIESCYTSTFDRYKNSVEDYETMKQDISILKNVVAEHSEKLHRIG